MVAQLRAVRVSAAGRVVSRGLLGISSDVATGGRPERVTVIKSMQHRPKRIDYASFYGARSSAEATRENLKPRCVRGVREKFKNVISD